MKKILGLAVYIFFLCEMAIASEIPSLKNAEVVLEYQLRDNEYPYYKKYKKKIRFSGNSLTFGRCSVEKSYQSCRWEQTGNNFIIRLAKKEYYQTSFSIRGTINGNFINATRFMKGKATEMKGILIATEFIKIDDPRHPDNSNSSLIAEKKKIEEEKKKIEAEKKRIAEAKRKAEEERKKNEKRDEKLYIIGSGTGFFVSSRGHAVSNDHVVGICKKVVAKIKGEIEYFKIISTDQKNDLGLIKGNYISQNYLSIKDSGAEFGEDIVAFGYPLSDALSSSVKLTRGIVSSLSGPGNNYSEIQIDAAIQPGNSGGPVMNMEGQVVGVASSGLNKLYMLEQAEYIPENVNFAVAAPTLTNFLKANGVITKNRTYRIKNTKELAKVGRPATLQLFCMNTKSEFEKLKKQKKHNDVLLEKVVELK